MDLSLRHCARSLAWRLGVCCVFVACMSPGRRTAPFLEDLDSRRPGDLCGEFTGRVLDADTGKPVGGVLIWAVRGKRTTDGAFETPAGHNESLTTTDADGYYTISSIDCDGHVSDFRLIAYKQTYVGYRSDRLYDGFAQRFDFTQKRNEIRLTALPGGFSHVRHVRFLGGGSTLRPLLEWEWEQAKLELERRRKGILVSMGVSRPIVASMLIDAELIEKVSGVGGTFDQGPLGDEPDTDVYSTLHFQSQGKDQTYDVSLRVWRFETDSEVADAYTDMADAIPGATEVEDFGLRALVAREGNIGAVGYVDGRRRVAVLVSCGINQCQSKEVLIELAKATAERLEKIWRVR